MQEHPQWRKRGRKVGTNSHKEICPNAGWTVSKDRNRNPLNGNYAGWMKPTNVSIEDENSAAATRAAALMVVRASNPSANLYLREHCPSKQNRNESDDTLPEYPSYGSKPSPKPEKVNNPDPLTAPDGSTQCADTLTEDVTGRMRVGVHGRNPPAVLTAAAAQQQTLQAVNTAFSELVIKTVNWFSSRWGYLNEYNKYRNYVASQNGLNLPQSDRNCRWWADYDKKTAEYNIHMSLKWQSDYALWEIQNPQCVPGTIRRTLGDMRVRQL